MSKSLKDAPANDDRSHYGAGHDNIVQSFQLEKASFRGRAVRLGKALDEILSPHGYPPLVNQLVAELATLAVMLSSTLKYDGVFSLQVRGDGPVSMLVSDVTGEGIVRACANFDAEKLARQVKKPAAKSDKKTRKVADVKPLSLVGNGYLAFTVDQKNGKDAYQGIVELGRESLVESVKHYFYQSEQIETALRLSVGREESGWRSGAVMIQKMPDAQNTDAVQAAANKAEDWTRCGMFLETCKDAELLDPGLEINDLLFRLFHEEGVRIYKPQPVTKGCRCSEEKVENVIRMINADDLQELATDNGRIAIKCEFCSRDFVFDLETIRAKLTS